MNSGARIQENRQKPAEKAIKKTRSVIEYQHTGVVGDAKWISATPAGFLSFGFRELRPGLADLCEGLLRHIVDAKHQMVHLGMRPRPAAHDVAAMVLALLDASKERLVRSMRAALTIHAAHDV